MAIQDSDLFLVTRGSESFKCEAQNLTTNVRSNDYLLVNRSGDSYFILGGELSIKLKDDDLLLVNRGSESFKATGAEVLDYIGGGGTPIENAIGGLTTLYTGTGTGQTIKTGVDYTSGGLIWILNRDSSFENHAIVADEIDKQFLINDDSAPTSTSAIASVGTNEFTIGNIAPYNTLGTNYVAWSWPNLPEYFECLEYTGDGTNANKRQTISHNLGTEPGMIIVKSMNNKRDYMVYHCDSSRSNAYDYCWALNDGTASLGSGYWGNAEPTASTFQVQGSTKTNGNGTKYKAWLWPKSSPYVHCGTYTGDGKTGRIINLPATFQAIPQWILIKPSKGDSEFRLYDCYRDFNGSAPYQVGAARGLLKPGATGQELSSSWGVAFGVGGGTFKNFNPEHVGGSNSNNQNNTQYLYMVIASPALASP